MDRPEKTEYHEYYDTYVLLVNETDIISALQTQADEVHHLLSKISEEKAASAYAPGKWSIRQLVGHLTDTEKIFAYRALRISRRDKTPMEGFEQDGYIENSNFDSTPLTDLAEEFRLNRRANIIFFKNLTDQAWLEMGTASGSPVSTRALAYMMIGHVRHHMNILKSRYLD